MYATKVLSRLSPFSNNRYVEKMLIFAAKQKAVHCQDSGVRFSLANALATLGEQSGADEPLVESIELIARFQTKRLASECRSIGRRRKTISALCFRASASAKAGLRSSIRSAMKEQDALFPSYRDTGALIWRHRRACCGRCRPYRRARWQRASPH